MSATLDPQSNPLINPPVLPHDALPLNRVRLKHFLPAIKHGIALQEQEVAEIKQNPDAPTFENTIVALEYAGMDLTRTQTVLELFKVSKSSAKLRKIADEVSPLTTAASTAVFQDRDLFTRVEAVYKDPASATLNAEDKMLLQKTYKSFVNNGINLPPEKQKRFQEINTRLSILGTLFEGNIMTEHSAFKYFVTDESLLDGVPQRAKDIYKENAAALGKPDQWLLTLEPYPMDVATHAKNRDLREAIYRASWETAYKDGKTDNKPVILEMVALKHELAQIMGFSTTAEQVISENMAKTPATVEAFLRRALAVYKPAAEEYLEKVRAFALEQDGIPDLKPWDMAYYGRALKEKTFSVDMETLRPYFELKRTFNDLAQHATDAFGVELRAAPERKYPRHHKDVTVYEVFNKASDTFVGLFYANYYARAGAKQGGAWMDEIQTAFVGRDGRIHTPAITNDCNYTKPGAKPTLLTLGEKETDFHEFGHAMHGMLTRVKYPSLAGTRVKRDFVELPSQLQEGWVMAKAKDRNDAFGTHFETGEKIPLDVLERVEAINNFDAGYVGLRQIFFGLLDMKWHTTDPAKIESVDALEDAVAAEAVLVPRVYGTMSTGFTHLFGGGYTAAYYGYKWADVMAADVFAKAQEKGEMYDREFLDRVRKIIYETGGSREPDELYRELMGRDPDPDALFRREGLLPPAPKP